MKFTLTTTEIDYVISPPNDSYVSDQIDYVEKLKTLGFTFIKKSGWNGTILAERVEPFVEVEFSSIEEILSFASNFGELIFTAGSTPRIEIYDGYRE